MKILIIHQYFLRDDQGGGSRFNQFVRYFAGKGHEVTVIAGMVHYNTGKKPQEYKGRFKVIEEYCPGARIIRTHVSEAYNKSFFGRLWAYFSFTVSSSLVALREKKHDLILVTSPPLSVGITGLLVKALKRIPFIFEIRDLWPESAIDTGVITNPMLIKFSYWLEKQCYKYADLINVLTPAFAEHLQKKKNVSDQKLIFIPNGADLDIFAPGPKMNWVREMYQLQDKFIITYLGAHGVANHLITLVETANKLRDFSMIHFLLIGDGMEKEMLIKAANSYGLTNITFVESQPKGKVVDFCNAADVCTAVLQKNDTFKTVYPNKVFDYMSCAKPIVLGIDGVARALVEEARAGIFVEPENTDQMAEMILTLYRHPELCDQYGKQGREYVVKNFSRESLAHRYMEVLEVLNKGGELK